MFSCEIFEIFKNTFFLQNNFGGCFCIVHMKACKLIAYFLMIALTYNKFSEASLSIGIKYLYYFFSIFVRIWPKKDPLCIPSRARWNFHLKHSVGYLIFILLVSSKRLGTFQLNYDALMKDFEISAHAKIAITRCYMLFSNFLT